MIEKEMQELLWKHPARLLNEALQQVLWEPSSEIGRADLVFEDRHGRLLIIEVKRGKLPRGAIGQLHDYFGMMKLRFPDKPVEMMVVANLIPPERKLSCESHDIECREISEKKFRDVAAEIGYVFVSELNVQKGSPDAPKSSGGPHFADPNENGCWSFSRTGLSSADAEDFLLRCDEQGREFFAAMFEAQKAASSQTKITWDHQSGFSIQFYFHGIGFAPIVWGFPARNRQGKSSRQRLDFPFDFSLKAGVPEAFLNELGASLSARVPLLGGPKRPNISIATIPSGEMKAIVEIIFSFAVKSSRP